MEAAKRFKITFTILSIGYILMGVLRIIFPEPGQLHISYLLGGIALLAGIVRVAFYFLKDLQSRAFKNDLAIGGVLLIAGVYLIVNPDNLVQWLPIIIGFAIVFDSILKLEYSFGLKRLNYYPWFVIAIVSLVTAITGILLIIGTFEGAFLVYYLGIVLIIDGIANLIALLLFSNILKKQARATGRKPRSSSKPARSKPGRNVPAPQEEDLLSEELPNVSNAPPAPVKPIATLADLASQPETDALSSDSLLSHPADTVVEEPEKVTTPFHNPPFDFDSYPTPDFTLPDVDAAKPEDLPDHSEQPKE